MDHPTAVTEPIYEAATKCLSIFDDFIRDNEFGESGATTVENEDAHRFFVQVRERRAQFKQWAAYTGAFAPVRSSLDARLAFHKTTRDMVLEKLSLIQLNLRWALPSQEFGDDDQDASGLGAVKAQVDQLLELAVEIRRSARSSHRLRPGSSDEQQRPLQALLRRNFPNAPESLLAQLATSIHIRGTSLRYLQRHNSKLASDRNEFQPVSEKHTPDGDINKLNSATSTTTLEPTIDQGRGPRMENAASMADTLHSKFSQSRIEQYRVRQKPTSSIRSVGTTVRGEDRADDQYPPIPIGQQQCQICADPVDAKWFEQGSWRRHVDQDLEPYVCISEQCLEPPTFFTNRDGWMEHMQVRHTMDWARMVHTERWYCHICPALEFDSKTKLSKHLQEIHEREVSKSRIHAFARRNRRIALREDAFACPLCDCIPDQLLPVLQEKPYKLLSQHVARHLKQLSFYSLSYAEIDWGGDGQSADLPDEKSDDNEQFRGDRSHASQREDASFEDIPETQIDESSGKRRITYTLVNSDGGHERTETFDEEPQPMFEDWSFMPSVDLPIDLSALRSFIHSDADSSDKIRAWLSAPDPSTDFHNARNKHFPGTGDWFLTSPEYLRWKTERSPFLWLDGVPGSGKTVLSSSVIADLQREVTSPSLLYFFFNVDDNTKTSTGNATRSFIAQLYNNRTELRGKVDDLFSFCQDGARQPESVLLFDLLENLIRQAGEVWMVVDALDECSSGNDERTDIQFAWIWGLRDASSNVHLLVTSRPQQDVESFIGNRTFSEQFIHLESRLLSNDIDAYIKARIATISLFWLDSRPDVLENIESDLKQRANGVFHWASCMIDHLKQYSDPVSAQKALRDVPPELEATYARILAAIRPEHRTPARRLLQFLVYSERPLRTEEAIDALAVDLSSQPRFSARNRVLHVKEVARYCSDLVISRVRVDDESGMEITEMEFMHSSIREFLTSNRVHESIAMDFEETNAKAEIARVCLSYLIDNASTHAAGETEELPLAKYAAQHWPAYAADVENVRKEVLPEVREYLFSRAALQLGYDLHRPDDPKTEHETSQNTPPALYVASCVDLFYSVRMLLSRGADCNAQGGPYGTALQAASAYGHSNVVLILLDHGADCNAQGGYFGTALQAASANGYENVVLMLLSRGADCNAQGGYFGTALQAASANGHGNVVLILLDHGADCNAQGGPYGTALQAASANGYENVVLILLDHGADCNAQGGYFGTALEAASASGYENVVQILLDHGADCNA